MRAARRGGPATATRPGRVVQPRQPPPRIRPTPLGHRRLRTAHQLRDLPRWATLRRQQHDPRPPPPPRAGSDLHRTRRSNSARPAADRCTTLTGVATPKLPRLVDSEAVGTQVNDSEESGVIPDDRLRLVFTCCHPALSREAQVAHELPDRLDAALTVGHLLYTIGHTAPDSETLMRADLVWRALGLARMLQALMPDEPEVRGPGRRGVTRSSTGALRPAGRDRRRACRGAELRRDGLAREILARCDVLLRVWRRRWWP